MQRVFTSYNRRKGRNVNKSIEFAQRIADLELAMAKLDQEDRQVLESAYLGYTHAEIAQELGLDRSTVTKRLIRIRQELCQLLS